MQFGEWLFDVRRTYFILQGRHNLKFCAIFFYLFFYRLLAQTAIYSTIFSTCANDSCIFSLFVDAITDPNYHIHGPAKLFFAKVPVVFFEQGVMERVMARNMEGNLDFFGVEFYISDRQRHSYHA
jgi:hypothetical protein